jgi:hypothetical protein
MEFNDYELERQYKAKARALENELNNSFAWRTQGMSTCY